MDKQKSWIGVDLDGTLAHYTRFRGYDHIGKPIPIMLYRVRKWIEKGLRVKIVTARASHPDGIAPVQAWLKKYGLGELEVTNAKDFDMIELWDDRAVKVMANTGNPIIYPSVLGLPQAPLVEFDEVYLSKSNSDRTPAYIRGEKLTPQKRLPWIFRMINKWLASRKKD
ncbi:MAG: hypothetical protein BWY82_02723 [Verrucomicrobia bacterium ADurb.Bin474]|nr:MAG: hypothetical protein BWY82_02723 [Verrucomicrobia bacterium ADurb.Bin474]